MNRQEKAQWVQNLKNELAQSSGAVLVYQSGLDAGNTFAFRQSVRQAGVFFKVIKNTLAKIAVQGTPFHPLADHFVGSVGLVYGPSALDAAKVVMQWADKMENIKPVVGMMEQQVLDVVAIKQLATLPDIQTLRGQIVAVLQAPARRMLGVVQAPAGQLARVFGAYGASGQ